MFFFFSLFVFADPRVADWPMMSSPFPTLGLCIFYAYFSKSLAPKLMEKRKPMDLRNTLVIYNLFQTIFSTWIFYEVSSHAHAAADYQLIMLTFTIASYHCSFGVILFSLHYLCVRSFVPFKPLVMQRTTAAMRSGSIEFTF